jgi:hypothetical protein
VTRRGRSTFALLRHHAPKTRLKNMRVQTKTGPKGAGRGGGRRRGGGAGRGQCGQMAVVFNVRLEEGSRGARRRCA